MIPMNNVVLVGFAGTGKTVVGKKLAGRLGYEFVDTDVLIEKEEGRSVSEIFRDSGESHFRKVEKQVIQKLLGRTGMVVATGGGAVLDPDNMAYLRQLGPLICLTAQPRTILSRLEGNGDRPLLNHPDRLGTIQRLLSERQRYYERADYLLKTDRMSVGKIVHGIENWLMTQLSSRISVRLPHAPYEVQIGWGILKDLGKRLLDLGLEKKVAVVTNPLVRRIHGSPVLNSLKKAGLKPLLIEIPDGERYKTTRWVNAIYDELVRNKFERGSCLIALGGGVIGDMTGFAAATYLRGVPYIQVPTTLAAQVDSSIGGKTGVNHSLGKNLIGAFYQPRLVYTDAQVLETLDRRNFVSGLAEVIKYGIISDAEFFAFLEKHLPEILALKPYHLILAIRRSAEIKAGVVQEDEREGGRRRILNYGHTLGHALESVTAYRQYLHGEAISIGMVFAARLAHGLGLCDQETVRRQVDLLSRTGLPVSLSSERSDELLEAMTHDKKIRAGVIHFVLADRIGHVLIEPVPKAQIRRLLNKMTGPL